MGNVLLPLQLLPNSLTQPLLPGWDFSGYRIDLGASSRPEVESRMLTELGTYGRQLGRMAAALEVVVKHLHADNQTLLPNEAGTSAEIDLLQVFLGDVASTRLVKAAMTEQRGE